MARRQLDWAKLLCSERRTDGGDKPEFMGTGIGREEIERDYDRVLFSAPTRRMADKTQVFPMEQNDSVRNRLTHSHEVSNLARSIGVRLAFNHREKIWGEAADALKVERTIPSLLAAVGLAHDLGNPPFGHQGEVSIRQWFRRRCTEGNDFRNFDGNCQTFRLLVKLQMLNDKFGLNLTYATLAALIKYPVFSNSENHQYKKIGIFESECEIARDVWEHTGLEERVRHPMVYVMEACDDIAYSVIDAEDTIKKDYASFYDLIDHLSSGNANVDAVVKKVKDKAIEKNTEFKQAALSSKELNDLSMLMFRVKAIAEMIKAATDRFVDEIENIMSGSVGQDFELIGHSNCRVLCESLKEFDLKYGYQNPNVLRLELKGHNVIGETMDMLWEAIESHQESNNLTPFNAYAFGRISENYRRVYEQSGKTRSDAAHLLCDFISGMSERYLMSFHDELSKLRTNGNSTK